MEEIFLLFLACLILGSSYFLYTYTLYTICALLATATLTWHWWSKKRKQLEFQEREKSRLERVEKLPGLSNVYLPYFENTVQENISTLKKDLEKYEHQEVLEVLSTLETVLKERILPRKRELEEKLDRLTSTNQLVLQDELRHQNELLQEADELTRPSIEKTIQSLEQKRKSLQDTENELIQFYSQTRQIISQMEEIRSKLHGDSSPGQLLNSLSDANALLDEFSKL